MISRYPIVRSSSRLAARALLLLAASGCPITPKFVKPDVALNAGWSEKDPRLAANLAVDVAWWKSFNDPALDRLIALSAEVARTYSLIRTYQVLIALTNENIAVQEDGQHIAQSRFRNGATSELDVAQATNLLESTRASIPELQVSLKQAENAL